MDVKHLFLSYLILPLIVAVCVLVMLSVNKKKTFLKNKTLVAVILLIGLTLSIPGLLGSLGMDIMPWGYILSQLYILLIGMFCVYLMRVYFPKELAVRKLFVSAALMISCLLGFYLFKTLFNLLSELNSGAWLATSTINVILPTLFWWSYVAILRIPPEIYKVWKYPEQPKELVMVDIDYHKLLVLELEIYKDMSDSRPVKVKVKAPENMVFGDWFFKFIGDYNLKFPKKPVAFAEDGKGSYEWIFFFRTSLLKRHAFIDPDLSIIQNGLDEKVTIYAKRVSSNIQQSPAEINDSIFI